MAYNMLGIGDPSLLADSYGGGGLQGFAGRFGANVTNGINSGIKLGTALTNYGAAQRLAPVRERNALQGMNTDLLRSQNDQLNAMTTQRVATCDLAGWNTDYCKALNAKMLESNPTWVNRQASNPLGVQQSMDPGQPKLDVLGMMGGNQTGYSDGGY